MQKSSKVVTLALLGCVVGPAFLVSTALMIKGCNEEEQVADANGNPQNGTSGTGRTGGHTGFFFLPRFGGWGGGGGGGMTSAPSSRGGFGSTGFGGGGSVGA